VARWSTPAASLAAAAVLTLFVVARGLDPGSGSVAVGPERIQASVAMTLPAVPGTDADDPSSVEESLDRVAAAGGRSTRRESAAVRGRTEPALAWIDARGERSIEREIRRFEERILEGGLRRGAESTLAVDGWLQPVRLGSDRWGSGLRPAALVRPAVAITPAPWNVDRAVSLP
jgi:hypothetical protein